MPSRPLTPEERAMDNTPDPPSHRQLAAHLPPAMLPESEPVQVPERPLRFEPPTHLQMELPPLRLDPSGSANPSVASATNAVRHRIQDGYPAQDTSPVPFNMVRLENLSDQIGATPGTVYQVRYQDVPTQRYMNAQVVPGTLVAYLDGVWTPTTPTVDVNTDGNFTLPSIPVSQLLITYAWQYLSDGDIHQFLDEARQWLREFSAVANVPDGLVPALVSYASSRCLTALARRATLAPVKAGDSDIDWSKLSTAYQKARDQEYQTAIFEREQYYSQGPQALDPTVVDVSAPIQRPYTPER